MFLGIALITAAYAAIMMIPWFIAKYYKHPFEHQIMLWCFVNLLIGWVIGGFGWIILLVWSVWEPGTLKTIKDKVL